MKTVLSSPRGTANSLGRYLNAQGISAAGKTGTAETGFGKPHAWFAGYTFNNDPERPDIAVVVLIETQGEGSEWAAPIFGGIVFSYFNPGETRRAFPWEARPGLWKSPTPTVTDTPIPLPTDTPTPTAPPDPNATPSP
jgi:penicillin-binding protein 2